MACPVRRDVSHDNEECKYDGQQAEELAVSERSLPPVFEMNMGTAGLCLQVPCHCFLPRSESQWFAAEVADRAVYCSRLD